MTLHKFEIHAIDAKRWALLHLPFAVGLGLWCLFQLYHQTRSFDGESIFLLFFCLPFVTFIVCFLAWVQAVLLNWYIWCIGGPVLYVKAEEVRQREINPVGI